MEYAKKLILSAAISLLIGIAVASPLLASELNIIPYPKVPEGPKAEMSVDVVYANYVIEENAVTLNPSSVNSPMSIVHYDVVLNVTNHSNRSATIGQMDFMTAEEVSVVCSLSAGMSCTSGGGRPNGGGNAFLEGVWLDDQWLNVTWLPGGNWPIFDYGPNNEVIKAIPQLPADAEVNGTWIEGVHVFEYQNFDRTNPGHNDESKQYVFVNGTWVDVTGRVRVEHQQPYVLATGTMIYHMVGFEKENMDHYANQAEFNRAHPPVDENKLYPQRFVWAGEGGFDNTWQPGESKLIQLRGTWWVGDGAGLESMSAGKITLYASVSSYFEDLEAKKTDYSNTFSKVTDDKQVNVTKTDNGYLYNAVLSENQTFQRDEFGVQVFIKPRS